MTFRRAVISRGESTSTTLSRVPLGDRGAPPGLPRSEEDPLPAFAGLPLKGEKVFDKLFSVFMGGDLQVWCQRPIFGLMRNVSGK
jgi:hypothetical protein